MGAAARAVAADRGGGISLGAPPAPPAPPCTAAAVAAGAPEGAAAGAFAAAASTEDGPFVEGGPALSPPPPTRGGGRLGPPPAPDLRPLPSLDHGRHTTRWHVRGGGGRGRHSVNEPVPTHRGAGGTTPHEGGAGGGRSRRATGKDAAAGTRSIRGHAHQ